MRNFFWKILLLIQPFLGNALITVFGGNFNQSNQKWYKSLNQSSLTPPSIVFPIVWTILYLLLGISAIIYYSTILNMNRPSIFQEQFLLKYLTVYEIQMALNFLWSLFFFGFQKPKISLIIVLAMIVLTVYLLWQSWRVNKASFWTLLPYLIWICFAMYLNLHIVLYN